MPSQTDKPAIYFSPELLEILRKNTSMSERTVAYVNDPASWYYRDHSVPFKQQ